MIFSKKSNGYKNELNLFKKNAQDFAFEGWQASSNGVMTSPIAGMTKRSDVNAYTSISWVSVAIDRILDGVISQPYFFCDKDGKSIDMPKVPESIRMPFENNYCGIGFHDVMSMVTMHMPIAGNAFIWKLSNSKYSQAKGIVDTFIPLNPTWVTPELHVKKFGISLYRVTLPNGQYFEVDPSDMIHFKQNTMFDPFWGVGNVSKARLISEGHLSALEMRNHYNDRRATPSLGITTGTEMNVDEHGRTLEMIRDKFEGSKNAGKILFMAGQDVRISPLSFSSVDMQYLEQLKEDAQTILSIFGCPSSVAGIPDANFATADVARSFFLSNTCNPKIAIIERFINEQFVWRVKGNEDRQISFKIDRHSSGIVDNVVKMVTNGIISPNRASELMGEDQDWQDESRNKFYLLSSLIPTEIASTPYDYGDSYSDEEFKKKTINDLDIKSACRHFIKSATRPKRFQVRYLRASLSSRRKLEAKYHSGFKKLFREQAIRVSDRLIAFAESPQKSYGNKSLSSAVIDIIFPIAEDEAIRPITEGLQWDGIGAAIDDITKITKRKVDDGVASRAIGRLASQMAKKVTRINETTRAELARLIEKSNENAWTIAELNTEIQNKFESFGEYRAMTIARTESRDAWDKGASTAYKEIGVERVDVIGCTMFEPDSDCGAQNRKLIEVDSFVFHPNHVGAIVPSEEV
jgi:HK97 family phage portal protein